MRVVSALCLLITGASLNSYVGAMSVWFVLPMIDKEPAACFGYDSGGIHEVDGTQMPEIVRVRYLLHDDEPPKGCAVGLTVYAPRELQPSHVVDTELETIERNQFYFEAKRSGLYRICVRLVCSREARPDVTRTGKTTLDLYIDGWDSTGREPLSVIPGETIPQASRRERLGDITKSLEHIRALNRELGVVGAGAQSLRDLVIVSSLVNGMLFVVITHIQTRMIHALFRAKKVV